VCRLEIEKEDGEELDDSLKGGDGINIFKYEIIKMCIEKILYDPLDDVDENLGPFAGESLPPSFKIAFNTLIKNEILIEDNE
jgi:hypothetical protein